MKQGARKYPVITSRRGIPDLERPFMGTHEYAQVYWHPHVVEADKCRQMLRAVLCQAIKDALGMGVVSLGYCKHARRRALEWFEGVRWEGEMFSWLEVQQYLGLSSTQVRQIETSVRTKNALLTYRWTRG